MTAPRRPRSAQEIADIQARLQLLADNPRLVQRMKGRRELGALSSLPRDSRRPTDASTRGRFVADYSSPRQDQENNYGAGLL